MNIEDIKIGTNVLWIAKNKEYVIVKVDGRTIWIKEKGLKSLCDCLSECACSAKGIKISTLIKCYKNIE